MKETLVDAKLSSMCCASSTKKLKWSMVVTVDFDIFTVS